MCAFLIVVALDMISIFGIVVRSPLNSLFLFMEFGVAYLLFFDDVVSRTT